MNSSGATYRLRITCAVDMFVPDGSYFHTGTWEHLDTGSKTLYVRVEESAADGDEEDQ